MAKLYLTNVCVELSSNGQPTQSQSEFFLVLELFLGDVVHFLNGCFQHLFAEISQLKVLLLVRVFIADR